jgi:hypothetical protein
LRAAMALAEEFTYVLITQTASGVLFAQAEK